MNKNQLKKISEWVEQLEEIKLSLCKILPGHYDLKSSTKRLIAEMNNFCMVEESKRKIKNLRSH